MKEKGVESLSDLIQIHDKYKDCKHRKRTFSVYSCGQKQPCHFKALYATADHKGQKGAMAGRGCAYWSWYIGKYSQLKEVTDN